MKCPPFGIFVGDSDYFRTDWNRFVVYSDYSNSNFDAYEL